VTSQQAGHPNPWACRLARAYVGTHVWVPVTGWPLTGASPSGSVCAEASPLLAGMVVVCVDRLAGLCFRGISLLRSGVIQSIQTATHCGGGTARGGRYYDIILSDIKALVFQYNVIQLPIAPRVSPGLLL